ncbi:hypothetical protein NT6N_31560 [Oceaniferula spumae]|uniref:STAS/SEC14 domain-containing protein n=1 Tax=Oceaniferula spumae TaxID=2979115 RepID=A0AAT9FQF1_9BACT
MITHKILTDEAVVVVIPNGPLTETDFVQLTADVDAWLATHQSLNGLLIYTKTFPGWEDFDGLLEHIKFVKDHHQKIGKVALVSDSKLATIAPRLAKHFIEAQIKTFGYDHYGSALAWLDS